MRISFQTKSWNGDDMSTEFKRTVEKLGPLKTAKIFYILSLLDLPDLTGFVILKLHDHRNKS